MTAIILRVIIYAAIAAFIYYAAKRLWRDLGAAFRGPGEVPPRPSPKVNESRSPDVIELKRGADGVYRPPGEDRR